jgi:hypothetical protein
VGEMSAYFLHAGIGPLVFALLMFVALRRVRLYPKGLAQGQAGGLPTPPYSPDAIGR